MLTSSYFELVPNVSLLLFHQIFSRAASLFGENFSPNSDLRSWSAVVARSLTTGDEQQVSEEEISKLQRVFSESPCFSQQSNWSFALLGWSWAGWPTLICGEGIEQEVGVWVISKSFLLSTANQPYDTQIFQWRRSSVLLCGWGYWCYLVHIGNGIWSSLSLAAAIECL